MVLQPCMGKFCVLTSLSLWVWLRGRSQVTLNPGARGVGVFPSSGAWTEQRWEESWDGRVSCPQTQTRTALPAHRRQIVGTSVSLVF